MAIENKENDLLLNMKANPNLGVLDLMVGGFSVDNTSLNTKDFYRKQDKIKKMYTDSSGKFNENQFNADYNLALESYNYMAKVGNNKDVINSVIKYDKYNRFAPDSQRSKEPMFQFVRMDVAPDRNYSIAKWGKIDKDNNGLSVAETAQTQEVYDPSTGKWSAAPNDAFWDSTFSVLVLSQWDFDADENGKATKDPSKIVHKKGELKFNSKGKPYYEKLAGRSVYGRQVLHPSDILTTDGSWANRHLDFLDSDDKTQSPWKALLKNTAIVGSMFIPYVGPVVSALTIADDMGALAATAGKMIMGSDNQNMSWLEGFSQSLRVLDTRSEYAQQNTWCWENFIGMTGQVVEQLAQSRFLFNYAPAMIKGTKGVSWRKGFNPEDYSKAITKETQDAMLFGSKEFSEGLSVSRDLSKSLSPNEFLKRLALSSEAIQYESLAQSKAFQNIGKHMFMGYMAGITVNDTYGAAKEAGVSDGEAALLTLGHLGAELAVLHTGIGELFFPELRVEGLRNKGITDAFFKDIIKEGKKLSEKSVTNAVSQEAKKKNIKFWFNKGKELFANIWKGNYVTGDRSSFAATAKASLAAGIGESVEEVSEELLADLSKSVLNLIRTGILGEESANMGQWQNMGDRYGMSALGGLTGGIIMNAATTYNVAKDYNNMTYDRAIHELVGIIHEGKENEFLKAIDKQTLGNKNLSALEVDENGNYMPGTKKDNQDLAIKNALREEVNIIKSILNTNGGIVSEGSFLNRQMKLLPNLKFGVLANTKTAGRAITEFNKLEIQILQKTKLIQDLLNTNPDGTLKKGTTTQKEENVDKSLETELKNLIKQRDELIKQKKEILDGKKSNEFIQDALFEARHGSDYEGLSFKSYAEKHSGVPYSLLSEEDRNKLHKEYEKLSSEIADKIHEASNIYVDYVRRIGKVLKAIPDQLSEGSELLHKIQEFNNSVNSIDFTQLDDPELITEYLKRKLGEEQGGFELLLAEHYDTESIEKVKKEIAETRANENLTPDEKEALIDDKLKEYQRSFSTTLMKNAASLAEEVLKAPLLDQQTRLSLLSELKSLANIFQNGGLNAAYRDAVMDLTLLQEDNYDGSGVEYVEFTANKPKGLLIGDIQVTKHSDLGESQGILNDYLEYVESYNKVNEAIDKLNQQEQTPLEQVLDEVALGLGSDIKFSLLFKTLNELVANVKSDMSLFQYKNLDKEVNEARLILKMFADAVDGSRVDNIDVDNVFGYNLILNNINEANKTEGWTPLETVDEESANEVLSQLLLLDNKLVMYQMLNDLNNNRKIDAQKNIQANRSYVFYNRLIKLFNILPEDEDSLTFKELLNGSDLELLRTNATNRNLELSQEERNKIEHQYLTLLSKLHDYLLKIDITDVDKIKSIIDKLDLFHSEEDTMMDEQTESIKDKTFLYQLAAIRALDINDFYVDLRKIIQDNYKNSSNELIAPFAPQEDDMFVAAAFLADPNTFEAFRQASVKSLKEKFEKASESERQEMLKRRGYGEFSAQDLSKNELKNYAVNFFNIGRYNNILFIEGTQGAGKSSAVANSILKLLDSKGINPKTWFVHTSQDNAKGLNKGDVIKDAEYLSHDQLMSKIVPKRVNPDHMSKNNKTDHNENVDFDKDGFFRSTLEVKGKDKNAPNLIIIDEGTKLSKLDYDSLSKYANANGSKIIILGDTNQSTVSGAIALGKNKIGMNIKISQSDLIHTVKLGFSMRSANSQKFYNDNMMNTLIQRVENYTKADFKGIRFKYYLYNRDGKETLCGDKVYTSSRIDELVSNTDSNKGDLIRIMDTNPDATFAYTYYSKDTDLYKKINELPEEYKSRIHMFEGSSMQGLESDYAIVELDPKMNNKEQYMHDLYTARSRSKVGSFLIENSGDIFMWNYDPDESTTLIEFSKDGLLAYTKQRLEQLEQIEAKGIDFSNFMKPTEYKPKENKSGEEEKKSNNGVDDKFDDEGTESESGQSNENGFAPELPINNVAPPTKDQGEVLGFSNNSLNKNNKNSNSRNVRTVTVAPDGSFHVPGLIYSNNVLSSGIANDNGTPEVKDGIVQVDWDNEGLGGTRLDGLNGLRKIFFGTDTKISENDYKMLQKVQIDLLNAIKTIPDKSELIQKIESILTNARFENGLKFDLGTKKIYINFAYKRNVNWDNKNKHRTITSKLIKLLNLEKLYQKLTHSTARYADDVQQNEFTCIIGTIDGNTAQDIVEIPFATLANPATVLHYKLDDKSMQEDYEAVSNEFYATLESGGSFHDACVAAQQFMELSKDAAKYKELINIFKLYNCSSGFIHYINGNWTPAKLNSTGLEVINKAGLNSMVYNQYIYDSKDDNPTPITDYVSDPRFKVSTVRMMKDNEFGIKPGVPFVLITDNSSIAEGNLENAFVDQFNYNKKHSRNKKFDVKVLYLTPPKADVEQYLKQIHNIIEQKPDAKYDIGNDMTSYYILKELVNNKLFEKYMKDSGRSSLFEEIKGLIDPLVSLSKANLLAKLKSTISDDSKISKRSGTRFANANGKYSLNKVLTGILHDIYMPGEWSTTEHKMVNTKVSDEGLNFIRNASSNLNIYYNVRYSKSSGNQNEFIEIAKDESLLDPTTYTVKGQPFTFIGKIDTRVFVDNNMNKLIEDILITADAVNSGDPKNHPEWYKAVYDKYAANDSYTASQIREQVKKLKGRKKRLTYTLKAEQVNKEGKNIAFTHNRKAYVILYGDGRDFFENAGEVTVQKVKDKQGTHWIVSKLDDGTTRTFLIDLEADDTFTISETTNIQQGQQNLQSSGQSTVELTDEDYEVYSLLYDSTTMTPLFQDPQAEIAALNDQKNINYIINEIILNRDADPDTDPNIKETCNKLIKYLQEKLNQDTDNNQQEDSCGIIINAKFNIL